jgi:ribosomal protein L40E
MNDETLAGRASDMKICPRCQMGNSDGAVLCRECGTSLGMVSSQDEEELLATEIKKYECRQRRKRILAFSGVILSGVLNVSFFIISIIRGTFLFPMVFLLFMPVMGYLFIFRADAMFKYGYQYDIANVNEAKPTDWYYFRNKIGGVYLLVISVVFMGVIAFH